MAGGGLGGMAAARYLQKAETARFEKALRRRRKLADKKLARLGRERVDQVEDDLGRLVLLAVAVRHALLQNKRLSVEQITAEMRRVDLYDGVADGKLDPAVIRPEPGPSAEPETPEEYLRRLEEQS